jgi:hypothetical protein
VARQRTHADYASAYERRNARAVAEGYRSYHDKRLTLGVLRGQSYSQAAGKPKPTEIPNAVNRLIFRHEQGERINVVKGRNRLILTTTDAKGRRIKATAPLDVLDELSDLLDTLADIEDTGS